MSSDDRAAIPPPPPSFRLRVAAWLARIRVDAREQAARRPTLPVEPERHGDDRPTVVELRREACGSREKVRR